VRTGLLGGGEVGADVGLLSGGGGGGGLGGAVHRRPADGGDGAGQHGVDEVAQRHAVRQLDVDEL
jgi:hypothetical protein